MALQDGSEMEAEVDGETDSGAEKKQARLRYSTDLTSVNTTCVVVGVYIGEAEASGKKEKWSHTRRTKKRRSRLMESTPLSQTQ